MKKAINLVVGIVLIVFIFGVWKQRELSGVEK